MISDYIHLIISDYYYVRLYPISLRYLFPIRLHKIGNFDNKVILIIVHILVNLISYLLCIFIEIYNITMLLL